MVIPLPLTTKTIDFQRFLLLLGGKTVESCFNLHIAIILVKLLATYSCFGPKVDQIFTNLDNSGTFFRSDIRTSWPGDRKCEIKVADITLLHVLTIWPTLGPQSDSPGFTLLQI